MTCTLAFGDTLTIPNTFTSGTTIQSSQMNSNFSTIATWAAGGIANDNIKALAGIAPSKLGSTSAYPLLLLATGTTGFSIGNTGDTQPRFAFDSDGKLKFGPGGATVFDTIVKRSAAGKLAVRNAADAANADLDVATLAASTAVTAPTVTASTHVSTPLLKITNGSALNIAAAAVGADRTITAVDPGGAASLRFTTGAFGSGALLYTDGTNVLANTAGTAGQVVVSGGTGAPVYAPMWSLAPGHRLTLTSGDPLADASAQGTLYLTPYRHNRAWLKYNGQWRPYEIDEISLALTASSGSGYAVYLYATSETAAALETQVWTNTTTRATAIATDADTGLPIKSGDATRVHVGDFLATGANQTSNIPGDRSLCNVFNLVELPLYAQDPANTWTYGVATVRAANANTTNGQGRCRFFRSTNQTTVKGNYVTAFTDNGTTGTYYGGIAVDSTTASFSQLAHSCPASYSGHVSVDYAGRPAIGEHYLQALEMAANTGTFFGDNGGTTTDKRSLLTGSVWQ